MERIGREVERRLSRTGRGEGLALTAITSAWPRLLGEGVARNAWPLRLGRDGTLHVATSSATWAFELDRMSAEIADRLAEGLGQQAPRKFRFRPGPVPEPRPIHGRSTAEEVPQPTPEAAAAAAQAAATIEDPELRELVSRAARASLGKVPPRGSSDRGFW